MQRTKYCGLFGEEEMTACKEYIRRLANNA